MYPVVDGIKFKFGEEVNITDCQHKARVRGKIKDIDCYIVLFPASCGESTISNYNIRFGLPNRHLELDWGKFSGYNNEFVVPVYNMTRIV